MSYRLAGRLLVGPALAATICCSRSDARTPPRLPDTQAGRVFRVWLDAYAAADSARLDAYVRQFEPAMSVHAQLLSRQQTGPWDIASIERSEPRHLELVLQSRADSTAGLVPLTMYANIDVTGGAAPRVATTFSFVGRGAGIRLPQIGAAQRAVVIDSVIAKVVRNYVFLDAAREIADTLRARRARGAYDDDITHVGFAQRLTRDLRELSGDQQMGVEYTWRLPLPPSPPTPPSMLHCGLEPAKVLDDGVGYVKLYGLGVPEWSCGHKISEAVTAVADTRALILDLRDAGDDLPESRTRMAYVASYLVSSCTHLGDIFDRRTARTEELWTTDGLPGRRFGGAKSLYILTSARTFAAAEELAYDLQSLGRATIVGERTAGSAHVTAVGAAGEHLLVHVPIARAINPITKTNWAGRGVQPDIRVPEREALATAQLLARGRHPRTPDGSLASFDGPRRSGFARGAISTKEPRSLHGVRFAIDTLVPYAAWRGVLSRVAGVVEFANGRGRLDVTAVSRAPAISVEGVTIAEPLAQSGDYYLFDNTGFVLVRPAMRTFSTFAFTRADFNHTGALLPGAFMMKRTGGHIDTLTVGDVAVQRQHAPVSIQWHMQPRNSAPPSGGDWNMYARGWLEIADAPAVEAGVARWFEVAAALATRAEGVPALAPGDLEVTSVTLLHRPGTRMPAVSFIEQLTPRHVASVAVDPERLVLPVGYSETRWPGFERAPGAPVPSATAARRWRALEDVASQYARASCKQAWLPERVGGTAADTSRSVRPLERPSGLR